MSIQIITGNKNENCADKRKMQTFLRLLEQNIPVNAIHTDFYDDKKFAFEDVDIAYQNMLSNLRALLAEISPEERAAEFEELMTKSLRKSDIMMQNRPNQYFLLLPELPEEHAESVFVRIRNGWKESEHSEVTVIRFDAEKISFEENREVERRR